MRGARAAGAIFSAPFRCKRISSRLRTPKIVMPDTSDASSVFSSGRNISVKPFSRAARAMEREPKMPRTSPSSANSPANNFPSGLKRACSEARRNESAMGRSKAPPSFLRVAGASERTIFLLLLLGDSSPLFLIAEAILSFASSTDLSGRPTIENA